MEKEKNAVLVQQSARELRKKRLSNMKYIDLSNGLEKTNILLSHKYKTILLKTNFDYKENYIIKTFIKSSTNLKEYELPKEYSCTCGETCNNQTCDCVLDHAQNYECNDNCICKIDLCENRKIQKGINKKLQINYINKQKGFGVYAKEKLKKDEFICEYVGEIINKEKANEKIRMNLIYKKPNYVLQVRENYEKIIINTFINAEEFGNVSRFLNHSCNPNLYFDIVRINHFIPHIAFYAVRDIDEGEELTFSYCDAGNENGNGNRSENEFHFSYKNCLCDEDNCIKFLPS